ncbi:hypothetical protein MKX01_029688 [Papaver californicum]|nr:hypothetical protein MKX01_029688 [Papaver californicum]
MTVSGRTCEQITRLSTLRTFFLLFQVDELISEYTNVNIGLEESGTTYNFQNLLELLWRTRADADIVNWFGLYERSDVAWKEDSKYAHMFDHLCDEFKLTQRFADLDRKFKRVELNIWFVSDE